MCQYIQFKNVKNEITIIKHYEQKKKNTNNDLNMTNRNEKSLQIS